jgi:flagellar basal body-associated protein FliL
VTNNIYIFTVVSDVMEKKQGLFIVILLIILFLLSVSIFFYFTVSFGKFATGHVVFNSSSTQDTVFGEAENLVEPRSERVINVQNELEFEAENAKVPFG